MFIIKIINLIKGYVQIQIDGFFLERFINICLRRNIFLWDIHRQGESRMKAKMSIKSFKKVRPISFKTKSRVRIVRRRGLPFVVNRYKKRKLSVIGVLIFCAMLWYFSSFVTGIEITGNEEISSETIKSELSALGVDLGQYLNNIDVSYVQNRMMTNLEGVVWVGVNKKGSKIYVDVKERNKLPEKIEKHIPCNIVASESGVVERMEILAGQPVIILGDTVNKGDLLVSGAMESEVEGISYVHSIGDVWARTWHEASREYSLSYTERIKTGSCKNKYSMKFLNFNMNFYFDSRIPYENYDKIDNVTEIKMPGDFFPSIFWRNERYEEELLEYKTRTEEELVAIASEELKGEISGSLSDGIEVLDISVRHKLLDNGNIEVTVIYECMENIAIEANLNVM